MVNTLPTPDPDDVEAWVARHLGALTADEHIQRSARFVGTQAAANAALDALDISGYAARRNEVLPEERRGATGLSPYIRHGLLSLPVVNAAVMSAPSKDRQKFRDELMWQEYARHVYARLGQRMTTGLRFEPAVDEVAPDADPWDRSMACMSFVVGELESDGWLVNQTRMWLASQWAVRSGARWQDGEDRFFTHLLDGSRAANRLGWQWTIGAGTGKPYGFSRWQVEKRSPELCAGCALRDACPVQDWPDDRALTPVSDEPLLHRDPDPAATAGPSVVERSGEPEAVWITAESLGDRDPALAAHPDLPVVFVFDEPLLRRLQLSSKRLVFLTQRLAELGGSRTLEVRLGDPATDVAGRPVATTFAPVPKWRRLRDVLDVVEVHPWPWLRSPGAGSIESFSAWRRAGSAAR